MYYQLIDRFNAILQEHDPCEWQGNTCVYNRSQGSLLKANGCCNKCTKLAITRCEIESLGCKSYLCQMAFNNLPVEAKAEWRKIREDIKVNKIHCVKQE